MAQFEWARLGWARPMVLVGFLLLGPSISVGAVHLADVRLVPDGSADPPGDQVFVSLWTAPGERAPTVRIRAFLVSGETKSAQRVLSRGEQNRGALGAWELTRAIATGRTAGLREEALVVPYAQLNVPPGTHQLGYEVALLVGGETVAARPTPLTQIKVSDSTRRLLVREFTRVETVVTTGKVKYFVGGKGKLGANEALEPAAAEVTVKHTREAPVREETSVNIPGEYVRSPVLNAAVRPALETGVPLPPASAGWMPLADVRGEKERMVRFITNRERAAAGEGQAAAPGLAAAMFTNRVGSQLYFGQCVVNVPVTSHRKGRLEETGSWWLPRDAKNSFRVESVSLFDQAAFLREVAPQDLLVFVHGYNNSFEGAMLRAAQLHYDLGFPGPAVAFSWPSLGNTLKYAEDVQMAAQSHQGLAEALRVLVSDQESANPNRRIHLVAHSLGNRVLLNALYEYRRTAKTLPNRKPFGQIVLAAPDVGAAMFNNLVDHALECGEQVTYYYCQKDAALRLSQTQNHYEPVGLYPYFQRQLVTVNADEVDTTFMGHLYFAGSTQVLLDLELLLRHGWGPEQRTPPLAGPEALFGHSFWKFAPRAAPADSADSP